MTTGTLSRQDRIPGTDQTRGKSTGKSRDRNLALEDSKNPTARDPRFTKSGYVSFGAKLSPGTNEKKRSNDLGQVASWLAKSGQLLVGAFLKERWIDILSCTGRSVHLLSGSSFPIAEARVIHASIGDKE